MGIKKSPDRLSGRGKDEQELNVEKKLFISFYHRLTDGLGRSPTRDYHSTPHREAVTPDYHPTTPHTEAIPASHPTITRRPRGGGHPTITRRPRRRSPDYRPTQLCARLTELRWDAPGLRHGMVPCASSSSSRDLSSCHHRYRCLSSCPPRACMRGSCMRVGMRGACMRGGSHAWGGGHRSRSTAARPRACTHAGAGGHPEAMFTHVICTTLELSRALSVPEVLPSSAPSGRAISLALDPPSITCPAPPNVSRTVGVRGGGSPLSCPPLVPPTPPAVPSLPSLRPPPPSGMERRGAAGVGGWGGGGEGARAWRRAGRPVGADGR